eukprot:7379164-Prymnesium_polylepis.1
MLSGKRSDAQTHPTRMYRRAWKLRCTRRPSAVGPRSLGTALEVTVFRFTVSAEAVGSWIRRLPHHRVVSDELSDAQTHPGRPYRRAWKLRCSPPAERSTAR